MTFSDVGFQSSPPNPKFVAEVGVSDGVRYTFIGPNSPAIHSTVYSTALAGSNTLGIEGFNVKPYRLHQCHGILYEGLGLEGLTTQNSVYEFEFATIAEDSLAGTVNWGFAIVARGRVSGVIGNFDPRLNGTFDFAITSAPEPLTAAVLIFGSITGALVRRNRKVGML